MEIKKTKAIEKLERKMDTVDAESLRHKVLETVRNFKTSWITLGQVLYTVWKDKLYKEWGYQEFDAYTQREIGIRKNTALKLLRSYTFLEKEEPKYLAADRQENVQAAAIPSYEAVDVLRQASRQDIDRGDYSKIRKYVLEDGKDAREVRKDLTQMVKQREELNGEDFREQKRRTTLKRFVSLLKSARKEIAVGKMLPEKDIKMADELIERLEMEIR